MTPVRLEPVSPQSPVKHSTTEPLLSHALFESIEMDHVISEVCYKGIILQKNYRKMTMTGYISVQNDQG